MEVLLAAYGGGHVNMIIPLYQKLTLLNVDVHIFAFTMAQEKLKELNIPFLNYQDFLHLYEEVNILNIGEELCKNIELHPAIEKEESFAYMGVGYMDLVHQYGEEEGRKIFEKNGRKNFLPIYFMEKVLNHLSPRLVIATNSPRSEKAILLAAKNKGFKSICLVDMFDKYEIEDRLGDPDYASKMFVSLDIIKQNLIIKGWDKEKILVTGNPAFDSMFDKSLQSRSDNLRKKLKLENKKVILFVKNYYELTIVAEEKMLEALLEYKKNNTGIEVICRPHPNDPGKYLDQSFLVCGKEVDKYELILLCDVVIYENSTLGLEAFMLGREVIQMDYVDHPNKVSADETGVGYCAKNQTEVIEICHRVLSRDNKDVTIKKAPLKSASDIIVKEIVKLLE